MPCHIRCDGSISAPTLVAPTRSTSFLRVTGENTRLCGCISMATRDVVGPGERVDLGPELRGDVPLVVQHVHVDPVPRVDHPGRVLRVGVRARGARTCVTTWLIPSSAGELDGAAQVVGVLRADAGQRVERVAVAVQPGQLHAARGELAEVVRAGLLRGQQQVDVAVRGRDEPAGVDLHRGQAVGLEHVEGLGEGAVVQAGGVGAELESHGGILRVDEAGVRRTGRDGDGGAAGLGGLTTAWMISMVRSAVGEGRVRRQRVGDPGDLVEERPGLVVEVLVVAAADARAPPSGSRPRSRASAGRR